MDIETLDMGFGGRTLKEIFDELTTEIEEVE